MRERFRPTEIDAEFDPDSIEPEGRLRRAVLSRVTAGELSWSFGAATAAMVFGLLHGLGFAGALGQIGLRSDDIPLALLFFNLGVEAGQLAFVAVVLAASRVIPSRLRTVTAWVQPALGYSLGTLATLWFLLRLPAVWGGPT